MRILLTGATGFIGCHVARALVRAGHEVIALNLPGCGTQRLDDLRTSLELIDLDLADTLVVEQLIDRVRPEACIHLAWYAEPGKYLTSPINLDCLSQGMHLARCLLLGGCRRLLAAGTCVEYDLAGASPLREDSPTRPQSLYAASKLALSQMLGEVGRLTELSVAWLRFFYLYGPHEDARRLVPAVIGGVLAGERVALTAGTQVRDYLHVEDLAAAVVAVLESPLAGPINVCSGEAVTVRELATTIGQLLGRQELLDFGARPMPPDEPLCVVGDNRKLREGTAWRRRFDLRSGLEQTIAWWARGDDKPCQPTFALR